MNAINRDHEDLTNLVSERTSSGRVSIVGAGPGAADLLTIRALNAIEAANVVYYDSLVSDAVLDLVRPETRKVFVGKRKGSKAMEQSEIEHRLREDARKGSRVVRLKGGDPFIFGRGGEELQSLRHAGIEVDVITGITAAGAAAAEYGIPLTHRNIATSVTFATGRRSDGSTAQISAASLERGTLVIYMGVSNADQIVSQLLGDGVRSSTPVAVVEQASLPGQRLVRTTVERLVKDLETHDIVAPALLMIGAVAEFGAPADLSSNNAPKTESADSFAWVHHPMG